jgi:hypothetical protein
LCCHESPKLTRRNDKWGHVRYNDPVRRRRAPPRAAPLLHLHHGCTLEHRSQSTAAARTGRAGAVRGALDPPSRARAHCCRGRGPAAARDWRPGLQRRAPLRSRSIRASGDRRGPHLITPACKGRRARRLPRGSDRWPVASRAEAVTPVLRHAPLPSSSRRICGGEGVGVEGARAAGSVVDLPGCELLCPGAAPHPRGELWGRGRWILPLRPSELEAMAASSLPPRHGPDLHSRRARRPSADGTLATSLTPAEKIGRGGKKRKGSVCVTCGPSSWWLVWSLGYKG